ncbi:N-6 DNA methylase [Streptomyces sp. MP131-18]|uniref:N-6 DNA methylase n=1 Tax=Streptomyces sp. MP131-18 TaxID=1857892 RepID=UPI00097CBB73|nr:N-6 DNA methylase [Streptomyces sp. MP131-18]ONK09961.1 putative type I restriction enzymeP M protein [Streptomyces sp. MP131-18]
MEIDTRAAIVVDRLWRAYAPFQRGRNTSGDLTSMLAILVLAGFVEAEGEPEDEFVRRWSRAVAEARIGLSPLMDLRGAMRSAGRDTRFPVSDILNLGLGFLDGDDESGDVPWTAAFLTALKQRPTLTEAGLPEVGELLLERHVQEGTFLAGEFHTPRAVAHLLVALTSPEPGDRILDPACGAGGLLAAAARRITGSGRVDGASFEAYATDHSNPRMAMMNLAIHGVDRPTVRVADPVSLFRRRGVGLADRVVSNPPFNQRIEDVHGVDWPFGPPPEANANFAWLQLAWTRLSENGIAAMIMPPRAAWSSGAEAQIRRSMVNSGALLGIIALPPNLFAHTAIPVHIWILARDNSRHGPVGEANAVLFIDAGRLGVQAPRQPRVLTAGDVDRIGSRLHAWRRSPRATPDEAGFSRAVAYEEILKNEGSLDPRLYISVGQERPTRAADVSRMLDELDRHDEAMSGSSGDLRRSFGMCERLTRSGLETPLVRLRDIIGGTAGGGVGDATPGLLLAGPSGSLIRADDYVDAGVPVVMPKDLTGSGFSVESIRYVTEEKARRLDRFRLHRGDVVLARRGELGRCAVVREEQQGWVCGTGCFVLRPPAELNADYLAAYLRSSEARKWLDARSTGSMTMKTISLQVLEEIPVALPDPGTQQVFADAMTRLDEHERLLRERLSLTQELRRDALNGMLTS